MEKIINWIDERFPLTQFIKSQATEYQTPRNLNYWWNFGFLAGVVLVLQILTGIFLAMHYKADANLAFDSIQHIMRDVNYGWLLRYIHATGASAFFIVVYIHMARTLYYGSYRAPRELIWWIGQVLLLLLMATAFMGYLLPWGQMSYWGAQVITNLFGAAPVVGEHVVVLLRGDFSVGDPTLNRFFSLHYLMPFLIAGVVVLHLTALHQVHSSNPAGTRMTPGSTVPFHPYYTVKDAFGLCIFLIVFCYFVFFNPNFFMESENNIPADPIKTPLHIVPEWYFLPFYAILRAIPDKLAGVIAMNVAVVIFVLLPFLDRSRIPAGSRYRPVFRLMFYVFIANVFVLGYVGAHPPQGILVTIGAVSTVIYFLYFAAMPFISKVEERWLLRRGRLPQEILDQIEEAASAEGTGGHS